MLLILDPAITGEEVCEHVDATDSEALHSAAERDHAEIVRLLLYPAVTGEEHVPHADAWDSEALRKAARNGHTQKSSSCC
eukprot:359517-Chlamydomonas_euryale.AAC.34